MKRKKIISNTDEQPLVFPSKEETIKFNNEKGFPNCVDDKLHKWRYINGSKVEENEDFLNFNLTIDTKVICEYCNLEGIGSFRLYMIAEEVDEQ